MIKNEDIFEVILYMKGGDCRVGDGQKYFVKNSNY